MQRIMTTAVLTALLAIGSPLDLSAQGRPVAGNPKVQQLSATEAISRLKSYREGESRQALYTVQRLVYQASDKPTAARSMSAMLIKLIHDDQTTLEAKNVACDWLPLLITRDHPQAAAALAPLLTNTDSFDMARRSLQRLPGESSAKALRLQLSKNQGEQRIGLINSLGARRDAPSVAALSALLNKNDLDTSAAVIRALGEIASPKAIEQLQQAPASTSAHQPHALLRAAEHLQADGRAEFALTLYKKLAQADQSVALRMAGLKGLAPLAPNEATTLLIDALDSSDALLAGFAMQQLAASGDAQATGHLLAQLDHHSADRQIVVIKALAQRGDRSAAAAIVKKLSSDQDAARLAAATALQTLGGADEVEPLALAAANDSSLFGRTARQSLARLGGEDTDAAILKMIQQHADDGVRAVLIRAAVQRRIAGLTPKLLKLTDHTHRKVRIEAYRGLAELASVAQYPALVGLLAKAPSQADQRELIQAVASIAGHLSSENDRLNPVLKALSSAANVSSQTALLGVLPKLDAPQGLAAIQDRVTSTDETLHLAAVRALADWPQAQACPPLLKVIEQTSSTKARTLAIRGYLRLTPKTDNPRETIDAVYPLLTRTADKRLLLSMLAQLPANAAFLPLTSDLMQDDAVRDEAVLSAVKQIETMQGADLAAVASVIDQITQHTQDSQVLAKLAPVQKIIDRIVSAAPKDYALSAYLDCGPVKQAGAANGPRIVQVVGRPWNWPQAVKQAGPIGTKMFDGKAVVFELSGLDPAKQYMVGLTAWDFDSDKRRQSIAFVSDSGGRTIAMPAFAPRSYDAGQPSWVQLLLPVPQSHLTKSRLQVQFINESSSANAIVSELWLMEKTPDVDTAAPSKKNVLIITGDDYPGHLWRQTGPVLAEILHQDPRLSVSIAESPMILASELLGYYDAVVIHFKCYERSDPGEPAWRGLERYVKAGGGVVVAHFGCGAFENWAVYSRIIGRTWNPKKRGHDPYRRFTVQISNPNHPVVKGMRDFETEDELYTCLDGQTPIQVFAQAVSKVDNQTYPMAFSLSPGRGRVIHCTLGHDVNAFQHAGTSELYRRAAAWSAGLPVSPKP